MGLYFERKRSGELRIVGIKLQLVSLVIKKDRLRLFGHNNIDVDEIKQRRHSRKPC